MSLGGKPRSLELEEDLGETSSGSRDAKSALKSINAVDSSTVSPKSTYRVAQEIHKIGSKKNKLPTCETNMRLFFSFKSNKIHIKEQ